MTALKFMRKIEVTQVERDSASIRRSFTITIFIEIQINGLLQTNPINTLMNTHVILSIFNTCGSVHFIILTPTNTLNQLKSRRQRQEKLYPSFIADHIENVSLKKSKIN